MTQWLIEWWYRQQTAIRYEWAHVPRPNWRCSRGGRDYW